MALGASRTIIQARIDRIGIRPGRRPLDEAHVGNMVVSFDEIGHRQPITLTRVADDDPARGDFTWWLNAGRHRLEAGRRKGWRAIDAIVEDDGELDARIAEADENLVRRDLNPLERAQALASRLEAWAARFPERVHVEGDGVRAKRGRPKKMPHDAAISAPATMGFAAEAAAATSLSRDTIERSLTIYRGIPAALQEQLAASPIARNEGLLRQLAALPDKKEQAAAATVLLEGRTKSLSDALAIAAGNTPVRAAQTPVDETVKAFRKLWGAASPSAKAAILHDLAGRSLPKGWIVREDANHG